MMAGDALLDAFIDANILVCVAYALWCVTRLLPGRLGLKYAYGTQLRLLNSVFLAVVFAPFIALAYSTLYRAGMVGQTNLNLSDMVIAHYLNGGFSMKASEFEGLILMREHFTQNVLSGVGWIALAAISLFVIGVVTGLMRLICSMLCLYRIVAGSYAWRSFGRLRIRLSDRTLIPFSTRGWRNYYVVLPSHMLGQPDELKVSLAHEFQHIRQGDLEWEILLEALKPLFLLNPAYHAWKRQVESLRELNCDSHVLMRGRIEVRTYCDTLLSVCQQALRRDRAFVIAVPKVTLVTADRATIGFGKQSFLERRIVSLINSRRQARPRLVYMAIVFPMIFAIFATAVSIQRPGDWSHDRIMLSTVVNLERMDEINRLSTFGRIRN